MILILVISSFLCSLNTFAQTFTTENFDDVYKEVAVGKVLLIDARPISNWKGGHFSKAISLPSDQLTKISDEELFKLIPKDKKIFTHCHLGVGARAMQLAKFLKSKGYDVSPFKTGFQQLAPTGKYEIKKD